MKKIKFLENQIIKVIPKIDDQLFYVQCNGYIKYDETNIVYCETIPKWITINQKVITLNVMDWWIEYNTIKHQYLILNKKEYEQLKQKCLNL